MDVARAIGFAAPHGSEATGQYRDIIGYVSRGPVVKVNDERNRPMDVTVYRRLQNGAFAHATGIVTRNRAISAPLAVTRGKGEQYVGTQSPGNSRTVNRWGGGECSGRGNATASPGKFMRWARIMRSNGTTSSGLPPVTSGYHWTMILSRNWSIAGHTIQSGFKQHLNENNQDHAGSLWTKRPGRWRGPSRPDQNTAGRDDVRYFVA